MITYMRLVIMGQKSQAFLTQMVQFWWGNCVSLTLRSWELAGLATTCCFATAQIMTIYPIRYSHNFNSLPSQEMSLQFSPITTQCKPDSDSPFLFFTNERVKLVISTSLAIEQITVIWLISLRPSYTDIKNKGIQFLPPQQNLASSLTLFVYFLHGFDIPLYNTLLWKSLSKGRK